MAPTVSRYKDTRFWAVRDDDGELICVCVYKRGAAEVVRRLGLPAAPAFTLRDVPAEPVNSPEISRKPVRALP